jgi:hypothetical protein
MSAVQVDAGAITSTGVFSPLAPSSPSFTPKPAIEETNISNNQEPKGPAFQAPGAGMIISGATQEEEVTKWLEFVSGEKKGDQALMEWLKDGQVLCRVANKIEPGICPRIHKQSMPFKQMENVTAFINASRKLGVHEKDVFSTVDLFEMKSPKVVLNCISSLGGVIRRTAPSFSGPYIGVAQNANIVDVARPKTVVTQSSGYRADVQNEVRAGYSACNHTAPKFINQPSSPPSDKQPPSLSAVTQETMGTAIKQNPLHQTQHSPSLVAEIDPSATLQACVTQSPPSSPREPLEQDARTEALEQDVAQWVEAVSGEAKGNQALMQWLKDGQVLCRMANKIHSGICPRINSQSMPFKQMENVTAFIQACRKLGVLEKDVFSTVDLYEEKNPRAVLNCIYSLGSVVRRTAPLFNGPYIGVAQNSSVIDVARGKTAVTQNSGLRSDITHEVRAGVFKGRRM